MICSPLLFLLQVPSVYHKKNNVANIFAFYAFVQKNRQKFCVNNGKLLKKPEIYSKII